MLPQRLHLWTGQSRRCFRSRNTPRHHPKPPRSDHCLAALPRRPERGELLLTAHSHSAEFQAPCRRARHRGTTPASRRASQISDGCQSDGHVARAQAAPCAEKHVRPFPAFAVTSPGSGELSEGRTYKLPLIPFSHGSRFGTVSIGIFWQALSGLS